MKLLGRILNNYLLYFILYLHLIGPLSLALLTHFPLNDGGMFFTIIQDILRNHFLLPAYTSYNFLHIPFAYPPLPFYIAAILTKLSIPLLTIFRFLPLIMSYVKVFYFYKFSQILIKDKRVLLFTIFSFAILPETIEWDIMGGGLTRSIGFLFAIITLYYAALLYIQRKRDKYWVGGMFLGLTFLSHPANAYFIVLTLGLLFIFYAKEREDVLITLKLIGIGSIMTVPWLIVVFNRHGFSPFLSAFAAGGRPLIDFIPSYFKVFDFTNEPYWNILAYIGMMGILLLIWKKKLFIPIWFYVIVFFIPGTTRILCTLPFSMAIGYAITAYYRVLYAKLRLPLTPLKKYNWHSLDLYTKIVYCLFFIYGLFIITTLQTNSHLSFVVLPDNDRSAMEWVKKNTDQKSKFLILSMHPGFAWWSDVIMEWFPTLAERQSVATVQGTEWLPNQEFKKRMEAHDVLNNCTSIACLTNWSNQYNLSYDYIYLSKNLTYDSFLKAYKHFIPQLNSSPNLKKVYEKQGVVIWRKVNSP